MKYFNLYHHICISDIKKIVLSLLDIAGDLIYPGNIYCINCGNIINDSRPYALCDNCVRTLNWANEETCHKCGKILRSGYSNNLCTDCLSTNHSFERGFACVEYGRSERDIIHSFKYKDKAYIGNKLAEIMYDRIEVEDLELDIIIPVPMYREKEKKRGYNQASILASKLSRLMDKPFNNKILVRAVDTKPMSDLGADERRENIKNAFAINKRLKNMIENKNILLIDDVYTTGSTADACTDVLLNAGADKVYLFVFASGANLDG